MMLVACAVVSRCCPSPRTIDQSICRPIDRPVWVTSVTLPGGVILPHRALARERSPRLESSTANLPMRRPRQSEKSELFFLRRKSLDVIGEAMWYCADVGPDTGLLMHGAAPRSIAVLESFNPATPVGTATCVGRDPAKLAVWRLTIRGELHGQWIVVDRYFIPAQ